MELQHVNVKLFLERPKKVDLDAVIPVLHSWVQDQVCEELLIDVADYRHLDSGPGVILIGHEADYSLDLADQRLGVRYNRKAPLEGTNEDRLTQATRAALHAFNRLATDPRLAGQYSFNGTDLQIFVNDRLLAPNCEETFEALKPELEAFFRKLYGGNGFSLGYGGDPRNLFSVAVKASRSFAAEDLLKNLS